MQIQKKKGLQLIGLLVLIFCIIEIFSSISQRSQSTSIISRDPDQCPILSFNSKSRFYEFSGKPIIWQYWHDDNTPLFVKLLVESIQCRNPHFRVILVHDSSFYCYLPELLTILPPELFSLLMQNHKVDIFRAWSLHKYGGVYIDVDSFPIGSFWPWYRKLVLEGYDLLNTNWTSIDAPISTSHIGPTRAGLSLFDIVSRLQIDVIRNVEKKLRSGKSYPIEWSALMNDLVSPVAQQLLDQHWFRYVEIDGESTVGQLVTNGLAFNVHAKLSTVRNKLYNMTWTPIVYWHYSGNSKKGILNIRSDWDELMDWKGDPSLFTFFVTCALSRCADQFKSMADAGQTTLTGLNAAILTEKLKTVKHELCDILPWGTDDTQI